GLGQSAGGTQVERTAGCGVGVGSRQAAARHSPTCLRRGWMEHRSDARRPVPLSPYIKLAPGPSPLRVQSQSTAIGYLTPSLYAGLGENRPMDLIELLLGRPLATEEEKAERIGPAKGIPIFGLDALSSAAYGPEAALTLLIPLGLAGVAYIVPISISIIFLLAIVYFSYRQTIMAYPQGGGSYTVASENLGVW